MYSRILSGMIIAIVFGMCYMIFEKRGHGIYALYIAIAIYAVQNILSFLRDHSGTNVATVRKFIAVAIGVAFGRIAWTIMKWSLFTKYELPEFMAYSCDVLSIIGGGVCGLFRPVQTIAVLVFLLSFHQSDAYAIKNDTK